MPDRTLPLHLPPVLEGLPDPVLAIESNGRIAGVNRAAERWLGRTRDKLISQDLHDLLEAASRGRLTAYLHGAAAEFSVELEFLHPSGVHLHSDAHAARAASGQVQMVVRPATSRARPDEAARHNETRFRFMARNMTEMVLAYDMKRRLTFVNPAAQTLTGYPAEEIERTGFVDWVHPEDRPRMLAYWDRLFEGKSFHEEEYRLVTRDGRVKWVAATWGPILDDHGHQVGVQGRERDITGRRMTEETLRQSERRHRLNEERYRTLFEDSPFPMWEEDFSQVKLFLAELKSQGERDIRAYLAANPEAVTECLHRVRILDVNRAAREFYGATTKQELLGSLDKLFDDTAWEIFREEIADLDATNLHYQTEFQAKTMNGDERTVSMIVSVAASPEDWSRVIVSFFDITDRKRLEDQVLQSQKLESLGRLAGGIAHDFNNLLMVVLGYAELLLSDAEGNDSLTRGLNEIKNAGERGAELTAQLLAFSRKQITQPRRMNLNSLIEQSRGMLDRVIGEDIRLEIALAPDAWDIKADRGQLHQVLLNLVVNGREAMPDGGAISIATVNTVADQPAPGEYVLLSVRDTGAGMDEPTRRNVFEPFFTTKRHGKGAGLGMATVYGVVTQAGGHISVESEPGRGTTFRLYFPRDYSHAEPGSKRVETLIPKLKGGRVLVVEDQTEVRAVARTILHNLGFQVLEAGSGEEALSLAAADSGTIDLLLTDVIMPGMNGRDLAAHFSNSRPTTKVIFMSGYTDRIMTPDGLLDESVAFLQKPFKPEDLANIVVRELAIS